MIDYLLMFALGIMLLYYISQFVRVLSKLKLDTIFPLRKEDFDSVWVQTQKPVNKPTYQGQKNGIIFFSVYFLFVIVGCYLIWRFHFKPFAMVHILPMLPPMLLLWYTTGFLNLFVVTDQGILAKNRFISWKRMTSYDIIKIDVNHKYYGHSPEINDEYEIKIHSRTFSHSCIVTSEETREALVAFLHDKGIQEKVNDLKNDKVDARNGFNHST